MPAVAQIADPVLGDLQLLRHFAWTAAEHAGRERAILGALISGGEPIGLPMIQRLATNRGKIEEAWQMMRFYAGTSSVPQSGTSGPFCIQQACTPGRVSCNSTGACRPLSDVPATTTISPPPKAMPHARSPEA